MWRVSSSAFRLTRPATGPATPSLPRRPDGRVQTKAAPRGSLTSFSGCQCPEKLVRFRVQRGFGVGSA